jgi:hypothetical protein
MGFIILKPLEVFLGLPVGSVMLIFLVKASVWITMSSVLFPIFLLSPFSATHFPSGLSVEVAGCPAIL